MAGIGGFWSYDPQGKHGQRYWDGHAWTSYVSDFGFTARDPLPAGAAYLPPDPLHSSPAAAPPDRPAPATRREERRLIVGVPAHVAASLMTAGAWLLVLPVIALWRRGARPLAATWAATVVLIIVAASLITGRLPDPASMQATAFADDGVREVAPQLVVAGASGPAEGSGGATAATGTDAAAVKQSSTRRVTGAVTELPPGAAPVGTDPTPPVGGSSAAADTDTTPDTSPSTAPTDPAATTRPPSEPADPTPTPTTAPTSQPPAATPSVPSPATGYSDCTLLTPDFPHGIGTPGAVDLVPADEEPVTGFDVDGPRYLTNVGLDEDEIACEQQ